jgi:outer membrane lipoprotein-sorting protein
MSRILLLLSFALFLVPAMGTLTCAAAGANAQPAMTATPSGSDTAAVPAPPRPEATPTAPTATTPLDALLDRVEEARQKVKTLKADVTYQKRAELLDIDEEYSGSFIFEMPRLLRMDLKEKGEDGRERNYIVGDTYGWIVYPDRNMAERFALGNIQQAPVMEKAPNPFEYGLTHGIKELTKAFDMKITGEETVGKRPATLLELTPKASDDETARRPEEKIVFWIDIETSLPMRVSDYKSRGQIIETFTLSNVQINARVRPLLGGNPFEYSPPGDYEVIKYGQESREPPAKQ